MDIEDIREICMKMPYATEDIKWGHDLCFCIAGKMFCVAGLDQQPTSASFKVTDGEFDELSSNRGFRPAPYVARYKWVLADDIAIMTKSDWEKYIKQSYELVKAKLPAKVRKGLEG